MYTVGSICMAIEPTYDGWEENIARISAGISDKLYA